MRACVGAVAPGALQQHCPLSCWATRIRSVLKLQCCSGAAPRRCAASHARPAVLPPARTWREQPLRLCNPAIRFHAGCTSSRRCSHCCTSNASSAAVEVRCFLQLPGCRPRSPPLPPQHKAVVAALLPGRGCCAQRRTPLHPYIAARAHPATCSRHVAELAHRRWRRRPADHGWRWRPPCSAR